MSTNSRRLIAFALSAALLIPAVNSAEAGPRNGWHDGGGHHHHNHRKHRRHKKNNNVGAAVAAGIIGLAAGAIIIGSTTRPSYAAPAPRHYYPPAPYPGHVHRPVGYQPWSPAWYDYCRSKYRSFNPATGTYTTYRGTQRFCQ